MTRIYLPVVAVFVASLVAWLLLPEASFLRDLSSVPLVGSLIVALLQIARDNSQRHHEVGLRSIEHNFVIGATSHMANVAFNKHAEFCEKYIAAVYETLNVLFREGPTQHALEEGWKLTNLRRDYAAWLSDSIEERLVTFEDALKEMGAAGHVLSMTNANIDRAPHIKKQCIASSQRSWGTITIFTKTSLSQRT